MVQRLGQVALLLVPGARPAVDLELERGVAAPQPGAQRAADERVHAELLLGAVQGRDGQTRPRQAAQRAAGPAAAEDRVAQAAREPLQRCRALEQREVVGRQAAEQRVLDVVGDDPVVAGEARHRGPEVALLAQRQPREVQRRGPALGDAGQRDRLLGVEAQPRAAQHERRLPVGHDEVRAAQLQDGVVGPQAPDGQPRLAAGRQREHRAGRDAIRQGAQDLRAGVVVEDVGTVEDEDVGERRGGPGLGQGRRRRGAAVDQRPDPVQGRADGRDRVAGRAAAGRQLPHAKGRSSRASHCARRADFP